MSDQTKAVLELQDTIQPLRDMRQHGQVQEIDRFIFVAQDVTDAERAARLRVVALECELTASHLRRVLEESRF